MTREDLTWLPRSFLHHTHRVIQQRLVLRSATAVRLYTCANLSDCGAVLTLDAAAGDTQVDVARPGFSAVLVAECDVLLGK